LPSQKGFLHGKRAQPTCGCRACCNERQVCETSWAHIAPSVLDLAPDDVPFA